MQNTITQNYSTNLGQLNSDFQDNYNKNHRKNIFTRFLIWLQHQNKINRTSKELSHLSDRQLADIGISRFDIKDIAHGRYQKTNSLKYYL